MGHWKQVLQWIALLSLRLLYNYHTMPKKTWIKGFRKQASTAAAHMQAPSLRRRTPLADGTISLHASLNYCYQLETLVKSWKAKINQYATFSSSGPKPSDYNSLALNRSEQNKSTPHKTHDLSSLTQVGYIVRSP